MLTIKRKTRYYRHVIVLLTIGWITTLPSRAHNEQTEFSDSLSIKEPLRNHLSFAVGFHEGQMLKMDEYIKDFLLTTSERICQLKLSYRHLPSDNNPYAADYNYPRFTLGFAIMDNANIRMRDKHFYKWADYDSRMGTSLALYGSFERTVIRTDRFNMEYTLENGIAYEPKPYNKYTNISNELTGTHWLMYFGAAVYFNFRLSKHLEVGIGPEFKHISNSALGRPNKGANAAGVGIQADTIPKQFPETFRVPEHGLTEKAFTTIFPYRWPEKHYWKNGYIIRYI